MAHYSNQIMLGRKRKKLGYCTSIQLNSQKDSKEENFRFKVENSTRIHTMTQLSKNHFNQYLKGQYQQTLHVKLADYQMGTYHSQISITTHGDFSTTRNVKLTTRSQREKTTGISHMNTCVFFPNILQLFTTFQSPTDVGYKLTHRSLTPTVAKRRECIVTLLNDDPITMGVPFTSA